VVYLFHKRITQAHKTVLVLYCARCKTAARRDKEIAVQIRGNSHYRNSALAVKSECLSVCDGKGLLGKEERNRSKKAPVFSRGAAFGMAGWRRQIESAPRGALLLYPFENKKMKG
jgi:hypothetical protein